MNDPQIRRALLNELQSSLAAWKESFLYEELNLCQGETRADIVEVNGYLHGYEIKSPKDSLTRLAKQVNYYSRVFDFATIVTSSHYLDAVISTVPAWWGILEVQDESGELGFKKLRNSKMNPSLDPNAMVQFLWRDKAVKVIESKGYKGGLSKKNRRMLWEIIVDTLTLQELRNVVLESLSERREWKASL